MFIVITDKGFLHFYDVIVNPNQKSLEYQFPSTHHFVRGPGEGAGAISAVLSFKMALEINTGIRCGVGLTDEILLCTHDSPSILSLSWAGIVNEFDTFSLSDVAFVHDPNCAISQITVNQAMDLFAWINDTGDAFVAQRIEDIDEDNNFDNEEEVQYTWAGLCFQDTADGNPASTCISINPRFHLIAVGDSTGYVKIFSMTDDRQEVLHSHDLVLGPEQQQQNSKLGPVSCMAWTADGNTLAVGCKTGGISIWSLFGKRLFQSNLISVQEDLDIPRIDKYFYGVECLFWGIGGFELLIQSSVDSDQDLYALKFLQSPLVTTQNMDNISSIFLVGDDRLFIRECTNDGLDAISLDLSQWESVQIPVIYLSSNWPIQYSAINPTGTFVAIAGTRGLAHYNIAFNRWKLFGNEKQEQSFTVRGGLFWHDEMLIAATEDLTTAGFQIRIFSRETNLDLKCLHIESVPYPVIQMTNKGAIVMCLLEDNILRQFNIIKTNSGVTLELQQQIFLDSVVHHIESVQAIAWNPLYDSLDESKPSQESVLLLNVGVLSVLVAKGQGVWEHIPIANKIEYFWVSDQGVCGLKQTLWAFGHDGLKIWTLDEGVKSFKYKKENLIQESVSFYPLSIMFSRGIIFGLESGISTNMAAQCIVYKPEANSQLFLDSVLRFFLKSNSQDHAFKFISHFRRYQYFSHSLEMLLHKVLEEEASGTIFVQDALLPRVIIFLKRFPGFLDIVAQCARKTDVSLWEHFFSVVGDPEALFQECLNLSYLRTATSYLIIIQTLKPTSVSVKFAEALLQKALDLGDFKTSKELIRFYKSIDGYSDDMVGSLRLSIENLSVEKRQPIVPTPKIALIDPASNTYHLEVVINQHARKLLREYRIRALGQFSKLFSIPLVAWLKEERKNSGVAISDWSLALASIHEQFNLLYPGIDKEIILAKHSQPQALNVVNGEVFL
ncbi:UNVERIFIED_CONTAM: hypothetical protein HDU68_007062 [Siphonaria sp. JEL0065]|nr:hypothetical protein HDU68_007062 [Siphonaria sp. JEL0065]